MKARFARLGPALLACALCLSAGACARPPASAPSTQAARVTVGASLAGIAAPRADDDAPPRIVAVDVSHDRIRAGDTVTARVVASTNVGAVTAHIDGYAIPLRREAPGRFALRYTVATIPSFAKRAYRVVVEATNAAGASARAAVTIRLL